MILGAEFDMDVVLYAVRYCLGRHSYAPSLMMDKLDEIWDQVNGGFKKLIYRDIDEHERHVMFMIEHWCEKEGKTFKDFSMELNDLGEWIKWSEFRKLKDNGYIVNRHWGIVAKTQDEFNKIVNEVIEYNMRHDTHDKDTD